MITNILGKLIYYNKVYRIETACPADNGNLHHAFCLQLRELEYKGISVFDFYRYTARQNRRDENIIRWEISIITRD